MKLRLLLLFVCCSFFMMQSQVKYEEGFIVDKSGKKINCLIKNVGWSNNPSTIEYKLQEDADVVMVSPKLINEFQIGDMVRYVTMTLQIDQSSLNINGLNGTKEPNYRTDLVFAKQLTSGYADLFEYSDNSRQLFYYNLNDGIVEPLVYKKYLVNNQTVTENNEFRKTLFDNLKCADITAARVREADYYEKDLVKLFTEFNVCKEGKNLNYKTVGPKGSFHLGVTAGVTFSSLEVDFKGGAISTDTQSATFDNQTGVRIGVEAEYVLPFNKNKWSLFLEVGYLGFSGSTLIENSSQFNNLDQNATADYKVIETPIGLRHYMFLSDKSKLFLNAAFVVSNDLSEEIEYDRSSNIKIKSGTSGLFGFGFNYDSKFSIEARLYFQRDITSTSANYISPLKTSSVIFKYQFL